MTTGFDFDLATLQKYLADHIDGFSGELALRQFTDGQSNPTYQVTSDGKDYVLRKKNCGCFAAFCSCGGP